ncbi:cadmium-translocating P-type ATPase [Sulfitobacter albidus]|uniref:Cadmium-translocating P-type ATPase n=2 Tax=Sulfitobacter albidus TaxID=2829501 RepID=A0A975JGJ9_9RHOB|nr:cadmium-translocating P-type ATPase [Sulfitobacter albidus]
MSCGACAARAQSALDGVAGITSASVNLADASGEVVFAGPSELDAALSALRSAGYPGSVSQGYAGNAHARDAAALRRDTLMAALLGLPVLIIEMGGHLIPALHSVLTQTFGQAPLWGLQCVLTTLVLFGPGRQFFARGLPALIRRVPDMNSLVALGTGAAYGYSVLAILAPGLFPAGARAVYFESACVIVTLILLGRWLEARAKGRTGAAIERLVGLRPDTARVRIDGTWQDRPLEALAHGDTYMLRAGDRIPADGIVLEGQSDVDQSMLTGEPVPVAVAPGDAITGGAINGAGTLICRATATGQDSKLAQIIRTVQTAQATRLPIQGLVDRITLRFVPAVLVIAALTMMLWALFGPEPRLAYVLVTGVSVLIIACPCAMGLATPTSIMIGAGRGAELGVLFRSGSALQSLRGVHVVAFDKTGTLTEGAPRLDAVHVISDMEHEVAIRLIAAAAQGSSHPLSRAIVAAGPDPLAEATQTQTMPGRGILALVEGRRIILGSRLWLEERGIGCDPFDEVARDEGQSVVYAAVDGAPLALLTFSDSIKPTSQATIDALKARGLRVALLSGDTEAAATRLGRKLGIETVRGGILPEEKADAIAALKAPGEIVAFVGDGINDAPALARADVGIAIGTGTDVAIDAADVVLMSGDPGGVVTAITVSDQTLRNIRQNLFWAFGYNVALIPVAAGMLYPFAGLLLSPALAAGAMGLSSVLVLSNALRLRKLRA